MTNKVSATSQIISIKGKIEKWLQIKIAMCGYNHYPNDLQGKWQSKPKKQVMKESRR